MKNSLNIVARNEAIINLNNTIKVSKDDKANKINLTIIAIYKKLDELKNSDTLINNLSHKKALKYTKDKILSEAKSTKINNRGNEIEYLNLCKDILRAYNIAFTCIFRNLNVKFDLLTISQVENLANHGQVKDINDLYNIEDEEAYAESVKEYIKSLKTRIVETKTFEKKNK